MSDPLVTVAIPTLRAGQALSECLASLEDQTFRDFEAVVVDNSGKKLAIAACDRFAGVEIIDNQENVGFGAAVNQVWQRSRSPYIATLNDDATAHPEWLACLVAAIECRPEAGMCASQVRLAGTVDLDSAGMLVSPDASSKQRGHGEPASRYQDQEEVLLPSGSAALYRRKMLEEMGGFDEHFFLYCEDTDLGLRARWAGWTCIYAPGAAVEHKYSHTAGAASPLKAYYVERNRLFVLVKNFPFRMLVRAPMATLARYAWHFAGALKGRGAAGRFREQNAGTLEMAYIALRAHAALIPHGIRLLRQRREIRRNARIDAREFEAIAARSYISPREVAAL